MISFSQFLKENTLHEDFKGWMPPYDEDEHLFNPNEEHYRNLPPEYLKRSAAARRHVNNRDLGAALNQALKDGYVRFGKWSGSMHGDQFFIQFNAAHPKGYETALRALKAMNPDRDDPVALSGIAQSPVDMWANERGMQKCLRFANNSKK